MPATVVAIGAAVGRGEWHGGGGVGPHRRLRTVRSSGVPDPRDSPVSEG
jgi:hypothetical protein